MARWCFWDRFRLCPHRFPFVTTRWVTDQQSPLTYLLTQCFFVEIKIYYLLSDKRLHYLSIHPWFSLLFYCGWVLDRPLDCSPCVQSLFYCRKNKILFVWKHYYVITTRLYNRLRVSQFINQLPFNCKKLKKLKKWNVFIKISNINYLIMHYAFLAQKK